MENLDFSNFTEMDINSLGTFLRGLAQEELKKLPEAILLIAIRRLGEQTGLPEDKLKARAFLAVELFKVRLQNLSWKKKLRCALPNVEVVSQAKRDFPPGSGRWKPIRFFSSSNSGLGPVSPKSRNLSCAFRVT